MKIHITNLYNFNPDDTLVGKQHRIAEAGFSLGYREMGIFSFPVETDTSAELSKRLDGVIAALESDDVVFLQLPTGNGVVYENLLAQKCKAYRNTKLIIILHDMQLFSETANAQEEYALLCQMADAVIVPLKQDVGKLNAKGISVVLPMDDLKIPEDGKEVLDTGYRALRRSDFYIKKGLMNAVEAVFAPEDLMWREAAREMQDEIQIGFGLYDKTGNYSVWVGVTMQSVVEHTDAPICFHIVHDSTLNPSNREKLIRVGTQNGNRIKFHKVDDSLWESYKDRARHFTIGTFFRIMLPELLPEVSRIIYLDADLLVNRDIKELWDTDIQDYCLAAAPDYGTVEAGGRPWPVQKNEVPVARYFNTGVLYMNLDQIRAKGNMAEEVFAYLKDNKEAFLPDQDALNVIYRDRTLLVDTSWNCFVCSKTGTHIDKLENQIYHYAGAKLILYSMSEIDMAYYETICRTPWGREEGPGQLKKALARVTDRLRQLEGVIKQTSSHEKKRIFYGPETFSMRKLYEMLTIREDDYRVSEEREEGKDSILPCRPFTALAEEKEEFVVFVLPEADQGTAIPRLEELGLQNGKDFFVIPCLLPPERGGYL